SESGLITNLDGFNNLVKRDFIVGNILSLLSFRINEKGRYPGNKDYSRN
ncbi:hypothetical protein LCGC14_1968940, partial [marine sediment metagenome]